MESMKRSPANLFRAWPSIEERTEASSTRYHVLRFILGSAGLSSRPVWLSAGSHQSAGTQFFTSCGLHEVTVRIAFSQDKAPGQGQWQGQSEDQLVPSRVQVVQLFLH